MKTTGSCLCGDIRWECNPDPASDMHHCHCSICRKTNGSPFVTFLWCNFRWLAGEEALVHYRATPDSTYERTFCPRCGSSGPIHAAGRMYMPVGCLDGDPAARANRHIFTGPQHNPPWFRITDGLNQAESFHTSSPPLPLVEPPTPPAAPAGVMVGSCLCGTVVFHITEPFLKIHNCHCRRCQKGRAAAHATNGIAHSHALTFIEGEDNLASYKVPDAEIFKQVFCRTCGSLMPERYPERDVACVSLGALDTDPGRATDDNIFVAYRAPWYEITDGLVCYDEAPPGGYM
jgi:hypothetical protein